MFSAILSLGAAAAAQQRDVVRTLQSFTGDSAEYVDFFDGEVVIVSAVSDEISMDTTIASGSSIQRLDLWVVGEAHSSFLFVEDKQVEQLELIRLQDMICFPIH